MLNRWIAAPLPGGLLDRQTRLRSITIVGTGPIAHGLAMRMLRARCQVTILGQDEPALALASALGAHARAGNPTSAIEGTIVILALPSKDIQAFVEQHAAQLTGKIIVDVSNPVDASAPDGVLSAQGISSAEHLTEMLGGSSCVVRAFNTVSADVLRSVATSGRPPTIYLAGDSEEATAAVGRLVAAAGMNPIDCGPLKGPRREVLGLPMKG